MENKQTINNIPIDLPEIVRLNLGCGNDIRSGYLNLDINPENSSIINCDVRILPFKDNSVSEIIANDILDLFSHREIDNILKEWHRVLVDNGEITIRVPNLKAQIETYAKGDWDADVFTYMLFGSQTNPLDFRAVAFDIKSLSARLLRAGFKIIDIQELNYSQDRGFLNQKITVKASKVLQNIYNIPVHNTNNLENRTEDILFPNKPLDEYEQSTENVDDYDYSFLLKGDATNEPNSIDNFIIDDNIDNLLNIGSSRTTSDYKEYDDYDLSLLDEIVNSVKQGVSVATKSEESDIDQSDYLPEINIVWEGSQFVYHSLALINRELCYNILNSNVANLTIIPYEEDTFDYTQSDKYKLLAQNDIRFKTEVSEDIANLPYCWIRHQWPPKADAPKGAKWVIMQPWEFSSLRKDFVNIFNQADEIWTPSNFSRKSFIDSGVEFDKVQIIPNGIDPQLFTPYGNKYQLSTNKRFKILFVGGTIYRKGIDILLQSYLSTFTNNDDVTLIIKDMGGNSFYAGQTSEKMIKDAASSINAPEIIYINTDLKESEMADLYRACDLLVAPYRGEGFGLPVLEAMGCGLPIVVTKGGATDDFVDEMYSWQINASLKSIGDNMDGKDFVNEAFVLEPDINDLSRIFREIKNNNTGLKSMGILAQYAARTDWTWAKSTLKLLTRLDYLYGTNMKVKAQNVLTKYSDSSLVAGEAEANYIAGDYATAEKLFKSIIDNNDLSDSYKLHSLHRLAIIYINNNDGDYYRMISLAEEIEDDHQDTNYVKAIKYASQRNNAEAIEYISKVIDNWEHKSIKSSLAYTIDDVLVLLGDLVYSNGDLQTAINIYVNALKINHSNEYACYGAGRCFRDADLSDNAREMFEWAVKINPNFEEAKKELDSLQ